MQHCSKDPNNEKSLQNKNGTTGVQNCLCIESLITDDAYSDELLIMHESQDEFRATVRQLMATNGIHLPEKKVSSSFISATDDSFMRLNCTDLGEIDDITYMKKTWHHKKRFYALTFLTLTLLGQEFIFDQLSELETRIQKEFSIS